MLASSTRIALETRLQGDRACIDRSCGLVVISYLDKPRMQTSDRGREGGRKGTRTKKKRKPKLNIPSSVVERGRLMGALIPSSRMYRRIGRGYRSCAPYAIDAPYYRMYGRQGETSSRQRDRCLACPRLGQCTHPPSLAAHSSVPLVIPTDINFTVEH